MFPFFICVSVYIHINIQFLMVCLPLALVFVTIFLSTHVVTGVSFQIYSLHIQANTYLHLFMFSHASGSRAKYFSGPLFF